MVDQILNNLIAAVNNLRDNADGNNTSPSVSQAASTSESLEYNSGFTPTLS